MDFIVPREFCPYCLSELNRAVATFGTNAPKPGDFTICVYCAEVLEFDEKLKPVRPTNLEKDFADDPELAETIRKMQALAREHKPAREPRGDA